MDEVRRPVPPRIFKVTYRSMLGRKRRVTVYVKLQYGALYGLSEALARAVSTSQVMWFRIERIGVITPEVREQMQRWPDALAASSEVSHVDWDA